MARVRYWVYIINSAVDFFLCKIKEIRWTRLKCKSCARNKIVQKKIKLERKKVKKKNVKKLNFKKIKYKKVKKVKR